MSRRSDETDAVITRLGALGQPTRFAVIRSLLKVHPDGMNAGDIARRCDVAHNTLSAHLNVLTNAGLLTVERRGREMYYRADLKKFRNLVKFLAKDCGDSVDDPKDDAKSPSTMELFMTPAFNVLFLCTQNSARSIMAEALLEKIGRGRFRAYSAGAEPARAPLPEVIERLKALGHDTTELRCKSWNEFKGPDAPRMDFIIALCDVPHGQFCPDLAGQYVTAAWPLPDPAQFKGSATERTTLLNELYAMIRRRIEIFTSLPFPSLDRMALKARLDEIGDTTKVSP
jgi:ArsR family transcriptional regulator, arsenate/arsenite/antimonite-responsive transcriptional repressor / arsenate reductase (thioredoxin)